jgi:hypothetical protein
MNLCRLIDQLANDKTFAKIQVTNDINPSVQADTCERTLKQVLYNLLDHAVGYTNNKNIRISAKTFHHIILVQIKYLDPRQGFDIKTNLAEIKNPVEHLGGCLYINDSKIDETTISVTFLNHHYKNK